MRVAFPVLALCICLPAQLAAQTIFQKRYGLSGVNYGLVGRGTIAPNGEFMLLGRDAQSELALLWTRPDGGILAMRAWSGDGTQTVELFSSAPDGTYYLAGTNLPDEGYDTELNLWQLADSGSIIWARSYRADSVNMTLRGGCVTDDQQVYLVGSIPGTNTRRALVIKLNSGGDIIWSKGYGDGLIGEEFRQITEAADGTLLISGVHGDTFTDLEMARMDPDGNLLWADRYEGSGSDLPTCVVELPEGDIIVTGYNNNTGYAGRWWHLSGTGEHLGTLDWADQIHNAVHLPDGRFVVSVDQGLANVDIDLQVEWRMALTSDPGDLVAVPEPFMMARLTRQGATDLEIHKFSTYGSSCNAGPGFGAPPEPVELTAFPLSLPASDIALEVADRSFQELADSIAVQDSCSQDLTGLPEAQNPTPIRCIMDPCGGGLLVEGVSQGTATVWLSDPMGSTILTSTIRAAGADHVVVPIPLELAAGSYHLMVMSGTAAATCRFVQTGAR